MRKAFALLLALLALLSLAACGAGREEPADEAEALKGMPEPEETGEQAPERSLPQAQEGELDLSVLLREEAFRELEHMNVDPRGYEGLRLKVTGEVSRSESHGKTFCYLGVRDEDGCLETLELRFPGEGAIPADFPADGGYITAWGVVRLETSLREGEELRRPVLTEVQFIELPDYRD